MQDYTNYSAADLLMDKGFISYLKKENKEDVIRWQSILIANPDLATEAELAKGMFHMLSATAPDDDKARAIDSAQTYIRTHQAEDLQTPVRRLWLPKWAVAASLFLALATGGVLAYQQLWGGWQEKETLVATFDKVISADHEARQTLTLPDGSTVILNYGSTIRYDETYNKKNRLIKLQGEAFFNVVEDPSRPFSVMTDETVTTALGTSFKVRAFDNESYTDVMLQTGKVKVETTMESRTRKLELHPGEEATLSGNGNFGKTNFEEARLAAWKSGDFAFEKAGLKEILHTLEFQFGITVTLENQPVKPVRFTGRFSNRSLSEVLETIAFTNTFDYTRKGNSVSIRFQ